MKQLFVFAMISICLAWPSDAWSQKSRKKKSAQSANTENEVVGRTKTGKNIVRRSNVVVADSSEAWRQDQKYSLVYKLISLGNSTAQRGFAGGYYLTPDELIEVSYMSGEFDWSGFLKIQSSTVTARLKNWWYNSFYTNLGIGYRSVTIESNFSSLLGDGEYREKLDAQSIGIDAGIGNRWQWEYFTIGCDWIGVFIPLTSSGNSTVSSDSVDEKEKEKAEDFADELGESSALYLLKFYLGVSF